MKKKNHVVSIRLTDDEIQPFLELIKSTKLSKTEIFKKILLSKSNNVSVKKNDKDNYKKLLFLFNKASNNINQLARTINISNKAGSLSEKNFIKLNNNLIKLNTLFKSGLNN